VARFRAKDRYDRPDYTTLLHGKIFLYVFDTFSKRSLYAPGSILDLENRHTIVLFTTQSGTLAEREVKTMTANKTAAEAVPEILQNYGASLLAGDPGQWVQNWTKDGVQLPPGAPMNVGKQMLYESMSAFLDVYTVSDLEMIGDVEIQEMGDWAYSRLNYAYKLTPKDGSAPYLYQGKALTIYQRQPDGTWKIHRDCFNSNTPDH
jgi:ketosteroid isomerase-like protein